MLLRITFNIYNIYLNIARIGCGRGIMMNVIGFARIQAII